MNIKIFVCCHQPVEVPQHSLLIPLQVGAALAKERFPGFLHDDTGDNISYKNRSYCELTGQYWAWKNVEADYYGFFHYRRYLYPNAHENRIYRIEQAPTSQILDKLGYSNFSKVIEEHALILPKGEDMYLSVRDHYAESPNQHHKDLELAEHIVQRYFPSYVQPMEAYLSGSTCYFGNIFIMRRDLFEKYCAWLFQILEIFDNQVDLGGYGTQELRVDGYLAERLLGVYSFHAGSGDNTPPFELPRVHFDSCTTRRWRKKGINYLLPPGSRRRAVVKKLL